MLDESTAAWLNYTKYYKEMKSEEVKNILIFFISDMNFDPSILENKVNKTMDFVMQFLIDGGQYKEGQPQTWIDVLIAAAYLYYATWEKEKPVSSLYKIRDLVIQYKDMEEIKNCNPSMLNVLCDTIESCRGIRTKVQKCIPAPNSPAQVLADAIWYTERF